MPNWTKSLALVVTAVLAALPVRAAEPVKVGFSMALTGGAAVIGKQVLLALQIWRDDLNAKGGLLGRPVALVFYDDQSNPATVPGIYAKLLDIDKVDLLVGPYATNMVAPAIPVIMQKSMLTIGIMANSANSGFHYPRYFSMIPSGPNPKSAFSNGFFAIAAAQSPKPRTVAIAGADAEYAQNAIDGARENARRMGFEIVYDKSYPPATADFAPILRAIEAASPDLVYVASYPQDSAGLVRAANETHLDTKMFGGAMVGIVSITMKAQLGPLLNGIVNFGTFEPTPGFMFAGTQALIDAYRARAAKEGVDPQGWPFPEFGYAAGQVLAQAVAGSASLDQGRIADYMRSHKFATVVGDIAFGADGEWAEERMVFNQYQNIAAGDPGQFKTTAHEPIVWPAALKSGDLIYPYAKARGR
jgi:branched-chain amino acid transport system substrate-binding protein